MIGALFGKFLLTRLGKLLPSWAWEIVLIAVVAAGLTLWHHGAIVRRDNSVRSDQKKSDDAAYAAQARAIHQQTTQMRERVQALGRTINTKWKAVHDQEISEHSATTAALLLRGPGAAAATGNCGSVGYPAAAGPSNRHVETAPATAAAGPSVYPANGPALQPGDAAIVSWKWLVTVVQEHDDLLTDVRTIEADHAEQEKAWEQMRSTKLAPVKP